MRTTAMPYFSNPVEVYRRIRSLGEAVLLDSAADGARGRWDIITAAPGDRAGLMLGAGVTRAELNAELERFRAGAASLLAASRMSRATDALPFSGGYIGHLSYELGRRLQGLPPQSVDTPLASVRYYPWAIVQDRHSQQSWLAGAWDDSVARELQLRLNSAPSPAPSPFQLHSTFSANWDFSRYRSVFERVMQFIRAGDCYQINIAQPFEAAYAGDPLAAYEVLRQVARAPFSAFLPLADGSSFMSLSPERFLTVTGGQVETRPIKGTRPRMADPAEDRDAATALLASEKERAENLMIVDLMRNDIGRYCDPGSVVVDELFQLESYATVHHLVSAVHGRLADGVSALDLLLGCMPGGSITGAPKYRAMQLIDELEAAPRQAWCGSVFYLSAHGRLDSNIAIRSVYSHAGRLSCWAGGGLVHDSDAFLEYQEQRHKIGAFLRALEEGFTEPPGFNRREALGC